MRTFTHEVSPLGVRFSLSETKRKILLKTSKTLQIADWSASGDVDILRGLAALSEFVQDAADQNSESLLVDHEFIASLSDRDAKVLGLPPSVPYQLRIWGEGSHVDNTFDLNSEFLDHGKPVYIDSRTGAFVFVGRLTYRIPDPLFQIIQQVSNFPADWDGKLAAQTRIAELIGSDSFDPEKFVTDSHVVNIRIRHVAGFSASVSGSLENPVIGPVLFSKHAVDSAVESGDTLDEAQQILDVSQKNSFEREFYKSSTIRSTYVLKSGEYVFIDPSVRKVFQAFRNICTSDTNTRKSFIKAPHAMLATMVSSEQEVESEELVSLAFMETAQFSDRVVGINQWEAPELPWLAEVSNDWGTESLVFEQPGNAAPVVIPRNALDNAVNAVSAGLAEGSALVSVGGVDIPVSQSLLLAMRAMLPISPDDESNPEAPAQPKPSRQDKYVVETIDGFEALNYVRRPSPPEYQMRYATPRALVPATTLLPHQELGLQWLIAARNNGLPGVLIADDMGLGKTLQALVFLSLYQEQLPKRNRKPALIVAPTGLLNNWLKEINLHLGEIGLGEVLQVFGSRLKSLKAGMSGRDTDAGVPMLNVSRLEAADVVLTTYESLRDYQISFAQVAFGVIVFDEIQKAKNPRSLISRAAAAVNGEFQIGLSGTPVENSLADLWTIMDLLAPGLIRKSLKEFLNEYSGSVEDADTLRRLSALKTELLEPDPKGGRINPVLRRLKSDVFADGGLPQKIVHPAMQTSKEMPKEQAEAYTRQLHELQRGQIKMIQALQGFKRISLSPRVFGRWADDSNEFIASSGRLSEFFRILDGVKNRNEKALIFVESRELQPILAQVLKERYALKKLPLIINGAVNGQVRQNSVDEFQADEEGFNVILISPKAGGVGLTLTAANHVIHLERWWNPAVEDQCNDRAYRIGQKKDVNVYTPIAIHPLSEIPSFDLVLDGILTRKRSLAGSLFIPSELTPEDFSAYFSSLSSGTRDNSYRPMTLEESFAIETGEGFEDYVCSALQNAGFTINKTPKSWDAGCDIVAKRGQVVALCQVKQVRSEKTLMDGGVAEIVSAKKRYTSHNPTHLVLITNARDISSPQKSLATKERVLVLTAGQVKDYGHALSTLTLT